MPLQDHFHGRTSLFIPWRSLHTVWPGTMMQQLNAVLPSGYLALASVSFETQGQMDIVPLEEELEETVPRPSIVVPSRLPELDRIEVHVFVDEEQLRLVAAVELVSPRNKDRPDARRVFAAKVASYLQERIGVIVVDMVTERRQSLHAELVELLDLGERAAFPADLYAVAYRMAGEGKKTRLEAWPAELAVGSPLPVLPLWIDSELAVPLDLDASYTAACQMFRTR